MSTAERENGSASDSEIDGNLVIAVTVNGSHTVDVDLLDRTLQFVLMEMGIDNAWKVGPPETAVVPMQAPA